MHGSASRSRIILGQFVLQNTPMSPFSSVSWLSRCLSAPGFPLALLGIWGLEAWLTRVRLGDLPDLPGPDPDPALPPVALCIPVRDEERELGPALDSWLCQDYPSLRILAVDDGSTDRTPEILARRADPRPARAARGTVASRAGWARTTPCTWPRASRRPWRRELAAVRRRRRPGRPGPAAPGLRLPGAVPRRPLDPASGPGHGGLDRTGVPAGGEPVLPRGWCPCAGSPIRAAASPAGWAGSSWCAAGPTRPPGATRARPWRRWTTWGWRTGSRRPAS